MRRGGEFGGVAIATAPLQNVLRRSRDPSASTGDYVGAITSFTLQVGDFYLTQQVSPSANSIIVFTDPLFGFYEPLTSVDPSAPLSGLGDLRGDVFFVPVSTTQILDDSLFLTPPDPAAWSSASAGLLDSMGGVLLDVQLDAICTGVCQPPLPAPNVPLLGRTRVGLLLGVLLVAGTLALARREFAV